MEYGALNDVGGAFPCDRVCNAANLGAIKRDSGAMNCMASLFKVGEQMGARFFFGHLSQGL